MAHQEQDRGAHRCFNLVLFLGLPHLANVVLKLEFLERCQHVGIIHRLPTLQITTVAHAGSREKSTMR